MKNFSISLRQSTVSLNEMLPLFYRDAGYNIWLDAFEENLRNLMSLGRS